MPQLLRGVFGPELAAGAVAGAAGLVLCLVAGWIWAQHRDGLVGVAGLVLTLATLVAVPIVIRPVPNGVLIGIAALAVAGLLAALVSRWQPLAILVFAAPGAWLLGAEMATVDARWVRWFVSVYVVLAVILVGGFIMDEKRSRWAPMLVAVASGGIFLSVPDTEEALVLLGVALTMTLLSVPSSSVGYGLAGVFASVGLLAWVIAEGGLGRPSSVIGAAACLGLMIVDPLARAVSPGYRTLLDRVPSGWPGLIIVTSLQVVLVTLIARVAGVARSVAFAGTSAAILLIGAWLLLIWARGRTKPARHARR